MFVYDEDSNLIAVSEIVATKSFSVSAEYGGRDQLRAFLRDGRSVVLSGRETLLENAAAAVVPAQPGFFKIWFYEHEGKPGSASLPVGAWRITADQTVPVAPGDSMEDAPNTSVLLPDGRVVMQSGEIHDTVAAWETDCQESAIKARTWKAEAERAAREKAAAS